MTSRRRGIAEAAITESQLAAAKRMSIIDSLPNLFGKLQLPEYTVAVQRVEQEGHPFRGAWSLELLVPANGVQPRDYFGGRDEIQMKLNLAIAGAALAAGVSQYPAFNLQSTSPSERGVLYMASIDDMAKAVDAAVNGVKPLQVSTAPGLAVKRLLRQGADTKDIRRL